MGLLPRGCRIPMGGAEETKCSGGLGSGLGLTRPRVTWWYALDWGWGQAPRGSVADLPGGFKQVTSCPLVSLCFGCTPVRTPGSLLTQVSSLPRLLTHDHLSVLQKPVCMYLLLEGHCFPQDWCSLLRTGAPSSENPSGLQCLTARHCQALVLQRDLPQVLKKRSNS